MSLISIGKRIGDMDIRLGIPTSKPQFSTTETNNCDIKYPGIPGVPYKYPNPKKK